MDSKKTIEILKTAILLERRGKSFYASCAEQSKNTEIKKIFNTLAEEEDQHVEFLNAQFINFTKNNKFSSEHIPVKEATIDKIFTDKIKKEITAADFESAAISAAIDMENRAITVYSEQAEASLDPEEKKFYSFLADWERGHHKLLYDLDKELKENIWNDNHFWPF
jgi:rubrerythrin